LEETLFQKGFFQIEIARREGVLVEITDDEATAGKVGTPAKR